MSQQVISGARLAYVVVPIEGTIKREVIYCDIKSKDKNGKATMVEFKRKTIEQPGGYMVYFPRGHAIRVKDAATLKHYGLDKKPEIINLQGLGDPNGPIYKMMTEQDEGARRGAMRDLEKMVIQLATAGTGPCDPSVSKQEVA